MAAPHYDPFKAHAYYIRTRKLHPRQRGSGQPQVNRFRPQRLASSPSVMKQKADLDAHISALQTKLAQLKAALNQAVKKESATKGPKKPTAADKSKKARESKKYRQEHKQVLKTKAKQAAAKSGGGSGGSSSNGTAGSGGSSSKGTATTAKTGSGSSTAIRAAIASVQQALTDAKARRRALG